MCVLHMTLNYITSVCIHAEGKGQEAITQDTKLLPKGDKDGITIHFQSNTYSFWPGALWPTFHYGVWKSHVQHNATVLLVMFVIT